MSFSPVLGNPKPQFVDTNGNPASGFTLTFHEAGSSTPLDTYTDSNGGTTNDNPLSLNARGEPESSAGAGVGIYGITGDSYKVTLKNAAGDTVGGWPIDDVVADIDFTAAPQTINEGAVIFAGPTLWQETALADLKWDDTNKRFSIGVAASLEKVHLQDGTLLSTPGTSAVTGTLAIVGSVQDSADLNGIQAVSVVGNYAYVACNIDDSMRIIDVTDPESPVVVGLGLKDATDFNGAYDIVCDGRYVYMSCNNNNSLRIIDVSDPETPVIVGGLKDDTNLDGIMGIYLSGPYVYACNQTDNSLRIIDVSDPTTPVIIGAGLKDDTNLLGAKNVYVHGEYAYVVSEQDDSLRIIDLSNILAPTIAGGLKSGTTYDGPRDIVVTGKYAYMTTLYTSGSLVVVDVSDPTTPVQVGIVNSPQDGFENLVVAGDYAYALYSGDGTSGLVVIDISDPTSPTIVTTFPGESSVSSPRGLAVSGKYAYMVDRELDKFSVIKLSGAKLPTATIGSLFSTFIDIATNALVGNNMIVGDSLNVARNLFVGGDIRGKAVTNYVRGVFTYIENDVGAASTVFDIDAVIGAAWESVGPTGSGATNIWTAMDSIPSTGKWVKIKTTNRWVYSPGDNNQSQFVNGRVTGSSTGVGPQTVISENYLVIFPAVTTMGLATTDVAEIPIDSSQRFDMYATLGGDVSTIYMYLIGFGV